MFDRELDRLIVADLEMQKRVMLDRAPVAAEQGVGADEIDGACDPAVVAPRHDQQDVLGHALADQREEGTVEIGPAPFTRASLHVEGKEGVPRFFSDVATVERMDCDSGGKRLSPFAPDRLAVARIEGCEKIIEAAIAVILPVKLLIGSLQETVPGEQLRFRLAREGHVCG